MDWKELFQKVRLKESVAQKTANTKEILEDAIFKANFKRWLKAHPLHKNPVETAAMVMAFKDHIEKDTALENPDSGKFEIIAYLDLITITLFLSKEPIYSWSSDSAQHSARTLEFILHHFKKAEFSQQTESVKRLETYFQNEWDEYKEFISEARKSWNSTNPDYTETRDAVSQLALHFIYKSEAPLSKKISAFLFHNIDSIGILLNNLNYPIVTEKSRERMSSKDGPRTLRELYLCFWTELSAAQATHEKHAFPSDWGHKRTISNHPLSDLYNLLKILESDLQAPIDDKYFVTDFHETIYGSKEYLDIDKIPLLIHNYLFYNRNKLPSIYSQDLHDCLERITLALLQEVYLINDLDYNGNIDPEERNKLLYTISQKYDPRKIPEPTIKEIEDRLLGKGDSKSKRAKAKFDDMRERKPDMMEETVVYYYRDMSCVCDGRKKGFDGNVEEGRDSIRIAFLKDLAENHVDDLMKVGLSKTQIEEMKKTGLLPKDSDLNIEHIADRGLGGTNLSPNLILIKKSINSLKNSFQEIQRGILEKNNKNFWIISWTPKKNPDGTYPKIYLGDSPKPKKDSKPTLEVATSSPILDIN